MVGITVERISKKRMHEEWVKVGGNPALTPEGLTLTPKSTQNNPIRGSGKIEIFIQEKMNQALARETIFHELIHAGQFLCGCEIDEHMSVEWAKVLISWLKERKKDKKSD